ncbi:hypothetical protein [Candidatus Culexarchaeum yellowstonense]|uniref:hypothetical protein n=1 Tax=Candidatus Culexarchaeum yellowstonense TaxID=2928963 RepID=UPI0026F12195|nr:hypothetical protein [Candidatus Culexarchaeum yellowstonense]
MNIYTPLILLPSISFITVYISTPYISKRLEEKNIVGIDLHKKGNQKIPTAGGIALLLGFTGALTIAGILDLDAKALMLIYITATLACLLGLLDDLLTLSKKTLVLFSILIGTPFLTYHKGSTFVTLTPFGPQDLGIAFWPLALLGVAFLANSVNIYAGFNGLEAGLGLITSTSLAISATIYGSKESAITLSILAASLLAFLKYNYYPAKTFIGNSGTYMTGAIIASAIIVGTIKTAGIIACTPYIINFILRAKDKFQWTVGTTTEDNKIISQKICSLWSIFMYKKPTDEKTVVKKCWTIQAIFGTLAIMYSYITVNYFI